MLPETTRIYNSIVRKSKAINGNQWQSMGNHRQSSAIKAIWAIKNFAFSPLEAEDEQETVFQSDHLWAMLFAVQSVPTPNMKKLISYIYSIPASNAYVESVFSEMKHLFNDFRNRMSSDTIAAELQIRRNSRLSCTDMYSHLLSQKELLTAISANRKYTVKK